MFLQRVVTYCYRRSNSEESCTLISPLFLFCESSLNSFQILALHCIPVVLSELTLLQDAATPMSLVILIIKSQLYFGKELCMFRIDLLQTVNITSTTNTSRCEHSDSR